MSDVLTTLDKAARRYGDDSDRGRHYRHNGTDYISVTTALEHGTGAAWAAPAAAKYTAEFVTKNWSDLRQYGIDHGETEFLKYVKGHYRREWEKAADFGSRIHDNIEHEILNDTVGRVIYSDADEAAVMRQWRDFVDQADPTFQVAEVVVVNEAVGYAGTLDLIVEMVVGDTLSPVMIDVKTGKSVYKDAAVQLAAYRNADYMIVGDREIPMLPVDYCAVLHLRPRGWKLIPVDVEAAWPFVAPIIEAARLHTDSPELIYQPLMQGAGKVKR